MPETFCVAPASVGVPDPVPLDDFVGSAETDLGAFHGLAVVARDGGVDVAGDAFGSGEIGGPFHEVTVAELEEAVGGADPTDAVGEDIAAIGRASEDFRAALVLVEGAIGHGDEDVVGAIFTTGGSPISAARVGVVVVVGIHLEGESDLFLVGDALDGFGFGFGSGEGWEEHACEDRDDGDNDEQFDERERPLGGGVTMRGRDWG